ncbi:uncharacterized protein C10orf143 homolog isoform X1 [Pipistrellus kuhlii]|uniref:uncharacterized protein C10orf143 homolog isoform X1 n=1 Tax=Pipistrellus kuhlii TaxID=59472 RepID=UPI001E2717ED|nr:uncharacterized protein C10orf143 homolog isoform X1 [Pipistrellus kuhlii]
MDALALGRWRRRRPEELQVPGDAKRVCRSRSCEAAAPERGWPPVRAGAPGSWGSRELEAPPGGRAPAPRPAGGQGPPSVRVPPPGGRSPAPPCLRATLTTPSLVRRRELEEGNSDMNLHVMANVSLLQMGVGAHLCPHPGNPPPSATQPGGPATSETADRQRRPSRLPRSPVGKSSVVPVKRHPVSWENPVASGTVASLLCFSVALWVCPGLLGILFNEDLFLYLNALSYHMLVSAPLCVAVPRGHQARPL